MRASACGLAAQRIFDAPPDAPGVDIPPLHLRAGIGVGRVWAANVGGVAERWFHVVAGEPLEQAMLAVAGAGPGDVMLSPAAWVRIERHARAQALPGSRMRLDSIVAELPRQAPAMAALSAENRELARGYVPRLVLERISAGQTDWIAEFRRATVLFVNLGPINCESADALDRLQRAAAIVETAVYRFGGSINQLVVDDKGTIAACAWGLALHSHGDDELRASKAALEIRSELQSAGMAASIGIASGDIFAGLRGNQRCCDYALIGSVVNLAARLMQSAGGRILCDAVSFGAVGNRFEFEPLPPLAVKGREQPVDAYRLIQLSEAGPTGVVGRREERRVLRERLDALANRRQGGVVIIEGDAGIGKSRLLSDVVDRAASRGVRVAVAAGDAIERSAPYHVWRSLFGAQLGRDSGDGAERRVAELIDPESKLWPFAPLLNSVLGLNLPETDRSRRVTPRGRALLTRDLLVQLFRRLTADQATLLILEDTHWFDSASWALVEGIERHLPSVLLLITSRPVRDDEKPGELHRLTVREGTIVLKLDALSPEDTRTLVCQRLRASAIDPAVARVILNKAEGHPFFTEELAHVLRDRGLVHIENGVCRFAGAVAAGESVGLPSTVHVMVSSRIDQLTIPQQLTVKVASVFGRAFDIDSLRAVYPIDLPAAELTSHVAALVARDLVRPAPRGGAGTFVFKHAITQEVAYSLLPYAQRHQLHAAVGRWYEQAAANDPGAYYPLLAHHWTRAEVPARALMYLEKAGEQAIGRFANEEAVRFFSAAVAIDERRDAASIDGPSTTFHGRTISAQDAQRTRWHRRLGDAFCNLGRWDEGRGQFERALALLGRPLPASDAAWAAGISREVVKQIAHRLGGVRAGARSADAAALMREAVCAHERVGAISYFYDRVALLFYAVLSALNLAEELPPSPELALVYADVSNIVGIVPLHRLARMYSRMARRTADQLDDVATSARVLGRSGVYRVAVGDWAACTDLDTSMALCDQTGDAHQWVESATIRTRAAHVRGEYELSMRLSLEIRSRAAMTGSTVHEIWGIDGQTWGLLSLGQHDAALELAEIGLRRMAATGRRDRVPTLDFLGAVALVRLARGELDRARHAAATIVDSVAANPRPGHLAVLGISAAAETFVGIWEREHASGTTSDAPRQAAVAGRQLERYARLNPPVTARALLWRGCAEWLGGHAGSAHATWARCLSECERFALPYEAARAHLEIGRHLAVSSPERSRHLERAAEGFRRLGAAADLGRVTGVAC